MAEQAVNPFLVGTDPSEALADFRKWSLDPDALISYLEHQLKGERWHPKSGKWVRDTDAESIMNNRGVDMVTGLCRTAISPFSMLSCLTISEINDLCRFINVTLVKTLFWNWKDYGIKKENLSMVVEQVMTFIFTGLKRAQEGGERDAITQSRRIIETYGTPGKKEGGQLLPFPVPFGKREGET